jgi:hypothetical protein
MGRIVLALILVSGIASADFVPQWRKDLERLHKFEIPKKCVCTPKGQPKHCHPGIVCEVKK